MKTAVRQFLLLTILLGVCVPKIFGQYSAHSTHFLVQEQGNNNFTLSTARSTLSPFGAFSNPNNSFSWSMPSLKDSNEVHSPRKATIMSAVIPGLGQIYNEKYWKVGVLYAGLIGLGVGYKFNSDSMNRYQRALDRRVDGDSTTIDTDYPFLSNNKVTQERNFYRTNRDRIIIGFVALYALQIIDANVDAHLREFEVNENLSLRVDPNVGFVPLQGIRPSLQLTLRF